MLKYIFGAVAVVGLLLVSQTTAEARHRGGCGCGGGSTTYQSAAVASAEPIAAVPSGGYRSYSYEPGVSTMRSYSGARKNAWEYPKTDARRYSGGR